MLKIIVLHLERTTSAFLLIYVFLLSSGADLNFSTSASAALVIGAPVWGVGFGSFGEDIPRWVE